MDQQEQRRTDDEIVAHFRRFHAERDAAKERMRAEIHATLERGDIVRETLNGHIKDWAIAGVWVDGESCFIDSCLNADYLTEHLVPRVAGWNAEITFIAQADYTGNPQYNNSADAARSAALAAGYTHVDTMGGPLPLADWKPYGQTKHKHLRFEFDGEAGWIRERPTETPASNLRDGVILGRWILVAPQIGS